MAKHSVNLVPQAGMQTFALQSPADELFLGGQAGPGKSWFLLYADLEDAFKFPDLRVLFLRRRMPELADLLDKANQMYGNLEAKFYVMHPLYKRPAFQFPEYDVDLDEEGNIIGVEAIKGTQGAIFVFGHMDQESTKYDYGGFEWHRQNWDELPNFLESQYLFMFSRLRSANPAIRTIMRGSGNPVGIGMLWVKRRFIDSMPPMTIHAFTKIGNRDVECPVGTTGSVTRMFIPGDRTQNKHLDPKYEANLAQLNKREYEALAMGKWTVEDVAGQLISSKWLDRAMSGCIEPIRDDYLRELPAIAFDYATDRGSDSSVCGGGRGNRFMFLKSWPYTRVGDAAYIVHSERLKWGKDVCRVAIDANGPGIGLAEMLEDGAKEIQTDLPEFGKRKVDIEPIDDLCRCTEVDREFTDLWKMRARKNFPNFRSQMYWKLKDDFEHDRIDLSYLASDVTFAMEIEQLQKELLGITYEERNGMIYIAKKEELRHPDRLGCSPDRADTLAMWNWVREREATIRRQMHPSEVDDPKEEEYDPSLV